MVHGQQVVGEHVEDGGEEGGARGGDDAGDLAVDGVGELP